MVHHDACSQNCLVRKRRIGELQFATCTTSCHSLRAHHNESQSCRVAMTNRRCYGCPVPTGYKGCECDLQSEIKSKTSRTRQICQAWKASSFDRLSSQNRKGQRKEELLSCMRYGNNRHVRALYFGGSDDNHLIPWQFRAAQSMNGDCSLDPSLAGDILSTFSRLLRGPHALACPARSHRTAPPPSLWWEDEGTSTCLLAWLVVIWRRKKRTGFLSQCQFCHESMACRRH